MKKIFGLLALTAFVFSGCSDDDNAGNGGDNGSNELRTISVERSDIHDLPSTVTINQVRFVVGYNNEASKHDLVTSNWTNGFSLVLPATVSSTYLTSVSSLIPDEYESSTVVVSQPNAMVTANTYFEVFNNNTSTGKLAISNNGDLEWTTHYIYADRNVDVKGAMTVATTKKQYDINVELKQGWNRVAYRLSHDNGYDVQEYKTNLPNTQRWYYDNRNN